MILRHKDPHIPEEPDGDPFMSCKFERRKYAQILTNITSTYADGFVLAVNNPWGEGKTTFIKMWHQQLKNNEFSTLYFNAWENDFENNALVALVSELKELENKAEIQFKNVLASALPLFGKLLPSIFKHLVTRYGGDDAAKDLFEALGKFGENRLKSLTDEYLEKKASIKKFKDSLEAFASEAGNDKPLIFFIDELDRCRPNYAVEVLEQIKHLFSVPGIVFVLSIDKVQLGYAIRGVYGNDNIDSDEYLRRFIDLEYSIPKPMPKQMVGHFYEYFGFYEFFDFQGRKQNCETADEGLHFKTISKALVEIANLTIRQTEKIFIHTRIVLTSYKKIDISLPRMIFILTFLKLHHNYLFLRIKAKNYLVQEVIDSIELLFPNNINNYEINKTMAFTLTELAVFYNDYCNEGKHPRNSILGERDQNGYVKTLLINSKFDTSETQEIIAPAYQRLVRTGIYHTGILDLIFKKIELMEKLAID